jgi:hypothetical protein
MARHGRSYLNVGLGVYPRAGGVAVGVTYNDSCTGTITLSGTRVEGKVGTDARSGQLTLSGVRTESNSRSESRSGTIFLTGSVVEAFGGATSYSDSPTGTIFLNGSGSLLEDTLLSWLRVREKPSLNQSVMVTTPNGNVYRWGEDETDPEKSFRDLSYGDGVPGGFDEAGCVLPRKTNIDYPDLGRLSTVQVLGAGGDVAGEYRLERAPVASGNEFSISPSARGWQAHLEDAPAAQIFVDIDLSHWGPVSASYHRTVGGVWTFRDGQVRADSIGPAVFTGTDGEGDSLVRLLSSASYDAGQARIGDIHYGWSRTAGLDETDTDYEWYVGAAEDDDFGTGFEGTANLRAAGPGDGTFNPAGTDLRYGLLEFFHDLASSGWTIPYGIYWSALAVYGTALTKRGSESFTTTKGLYASDCIQYIVENYAPKLTIGTIDATTFVIPHLEFRSSTLPSEMIKQANRFHLHDWGVWENKTFDYRARGSGRNWLTRTGECRLEQTGPQTDRLFNGVIMLYQDVDGTAKTVGPTGSGTDTETADLLDTDTELPMNQFSPVINRWALMDMG